MWIYEKKLEIPVRVSGPNPALAKHVIAQYGGPEGELSAALRYLNMRYSMPTSRAKGVLTDIGTEELAHMEIVATLVYKLMEGASIEQIKAADMGGFYAEHDKSLYWVNPEGVPWVAAYVSATGDPIADLHENLAAEQKARAVYENLIHLSDDPCVTDVLRYLREREVVHFQRFGETLMQVEEYMKQKKFY